MRNKLQALKTQIDAANNQPAYNVAGKIKHAENAVSISYQIIEELVHRLEDLENARN